MRPIVGVLANRELPQSDTWGARRHWWIGRRLECDGVVAGGPGGSAFVLETLVVLDGPPKAALGGTLAMFVGPQRRVRRLLPK